MDEKALAVLRADVLGQMNLIDLIFDKVADRATGLMPDNEVQLESAAYQLHNLYNALEDLFKLVAFHFENQLQDPSKWHIEMLQRMAQEIPGIRPALITHDAFVLLNSLRSFRHFFRHAYNTPIDYAQLGINLDRARQLRQPLERDVANFLSKFNG